MIICNSRKFIFVHINKTAGTSLTTALDPHLQWNDIVLGSTALGRALDQPFLERFGLYKHSTASEIRAVVGERVWEEYRTFAVLRDPVDRAVSLYHYLQRIEASRPPGRHLLRRLLGTSRPTWLALQALRESKDFSGFIRHPKLPYDPGFLGQHTFVLDESGQCIVDTLLRFETVEEDFRKLCYGFGIRIGHIGHENRSEGRQGAQCAVSDSDIDFLRAHFAKDYELLENLLPEPQAAGGRRGSFGADRRL